MAIELDWKPDPPRGRYVKILLREVLTSPPSILGLSCGPGVPVYECSYNDISAQQLKWARERCAEAELVAGDMSILTYEPQTSDGVTCHYTLFHLPRAEQKEFLERIYSWLTSEGYPSIISRRLTKRRFGEFLGHGMLWWSFDMQANQSMVTEVGFEIVEAEVSGGPNEDDFSAEAKFLWTVARKIDVSIEGNTRDLKAWEPGRFEEEAANGSEVDVSLRWVERPCYLGSKRVPRRRHREWGVQSSRVFQQPNFEDHFTSILKSSK